MINSSSLKPGDVTRLKAEPGLAMDISIEMPDGTTIATTLAPGVECVVTAGTASPINIYINGVDHGHSRGVD